MSLAFSSANDTRVGLHSNTLRCCRESLAINKDSAFACSVLPQVVSLEKVEVVIKLAKIAKPIFV